MILGVVVGTLSSLFIASPIAYKVMVKLRSRKGEPVKEVAAGEVK